MTEITYHPEPGYQILPLEVLHESPLNPRKHFDPTALADLAASIAAKGVLTPLLVRVNSAGYEIGAGHRRFRAAKLAGLTEVPTVVRPMSDDDFLELLTVENLQREDLHALEEAQGYHQLIATKRYDVARVAEKVGRSEKYVYDRLKLLSLIKPLQALFLDGKFSAGHAILLARLRPEDQRRAAGMDEKGKIEVNDEDYRHTVDGGLFTEEHTLFDDRAEDAELPAPTLKARSVRELDAWITEHVKFHVAEADPVLFPETVGIVQQAQAEKEKVVSITYDHAIPPDARDGQKVLGPRSFKEATGTGGHKACDYAVTGVIVIGAGRGEALKVCLAKEKCAVHWKAWQKEREQRAKGAAKKGEASKEQDRYAADRARQEAEYKVAQAEQKRWTKARPAILTAVAAAVKKSVAMADGTLADLILSACAPRQSYGEKPVKVADYIPRGKTVEDLIRHAAFSVLVGAITSYHAREEFPKVAKALGVDVKAIVDEAAPPEPKKAPEPKPAAAKKIRAKKKAKAAKPAKATARKRKAKK